MMPLKIMISLGDWFLPPWTMQSPDINKAILFPEKETSLIPDKPG